MRARASFAGSYQRRHDAVRPCRPMAASIPRRDCCNLACLRCNVGDVNLNDARDDSSALSHPLQASPGEISVEHTRTEAADVGTDLAWLVVLRITAGLSALIIPPIYWVWPQLFDGFLQSQVQIPYAKLEWIVPLPPLVMKTLLLIAMACGIGVMLGHYFRVAAFTLFAIYAYHFLLDSSYYQSTAYLLVLLSFLLACSPAHHLCSFDAERIPARLRGQGSRLYLLLFRFQIALVYFYAGVAKIDEDWIAGRTLSVMVPTSRLAALSSPFVSAHGVAVAMSWIGLLFDLLVAPALFFRRTRTVSLIALILFHLHNAVTFRLVHLPWMMLLVASVFLDPDWPRKLLRFLPRMAPLPTLEAAPRPSRWAVLFAISYCAIQTAVPLRKWLYSGNAYFTECGFPFSWAMRSRVKSATTELLVVDHKTAERELIPLGRGMQPMQAARAQGDPHAIWLLGQRLSRAAQKDGRTVSVYARSTVSLNGSAPTVFVACDVDLTQHPFPLFGVPFWVTRRPRTLGTSAAADERHCTPSLAQMPPR